VPARAVASGDSKWLSTPRRRPDPLPRRWPISRPPSLRSRHQQPQHHPPLPPSPSFDPRSSPLLQLATMAAASPRLNWPEAEPLSPSLHHQINHWIPAILPTSFPSRRSVPGRRALRHPSRRPPWPGAPALRSSPSPASCLGGTTASRRSPRWSERRRRWPVAPGRAPAPAAPLCPAREVGDGQRGPGLFF
jgi:hypothetical protein